jgi:hypothetical protein
MGSDNTVGVIVSDQSLKDHHVNACYDATMGDVSSRLLKAFGLDDISLYYIDTDSGRGSI